jgi:hypothetical protein|tara:strand:+ start:1723 stop:1926 length:204 start_codon:yes stop_codon:yes gene_type:complete
MSKWLKWKPTDKGSIKVVTLDRHNELEKMVGKIITGFGDELIDLHKRCNLLGDAILELKKGDHDGNN